MIWGRKEIEKINFKDFNDMHLLVLVVHKDIQLYMVLKTLKIIPRPYMFCFIIL